MFFAVAESMAGLFESLRNRVSINMKEEENEEQ